MPELDVTDVLDDPDFVDITLVLRRVVQQVGDDGMLIEQFKDPEPLSGVVTVDNSRRLEIMPDGTRIQSAIRVNTATPIYVTSPAGAPERRIADRIEWRGFNYKVDAVDDYGAYGAGLYVAHCSVQEVS